MSRADHNVSEGSSSDSDAVLIRASSTPARRVLRKKRGRGSMDVSFGDLSEISNQEGSKGNLCSGEVSDVGNDVKSKRLRLDDTDTGQESSDEESNEEIENDSMGEDGSQLGSGFDFEFSEAPPDVNPNPLPGIAPDHVADTEQQDQEEC